MTRLLVALLLLHHIEGVCKPFSSATLAARRAAARVGDAVQRARLARQEAVERARRGRLADGAGEPLPAVLAAAERVEREQRAALPAAQPVRGWSDAVRDYEREGGA